MYSLWIRSRAFWMVMSAPVLMIAAFAVAVDIDPGHLDRAMALATVGLGAAAAAGVRLATREPTLVPLVEDDPGDGASTLSAAQAATYRDLFENATDIVFTTDLSGHFLAGNKAVQRLLGYTVEEAKSLTWERLVAPYDMWKARKMYRRHAAGEKRISFELDTVTAAGEIKTFEIGSRPMFRDGRLCGFHGIARDVTSRKEMEKQLETARREAELANESKSTFLANMSHEIRTPINGILGFLSLFAKTGLTPEQKECLVPVEESARHLLKIINDILDLSKIEAGRFSIDNETFNFRDTVKSAVDLLRPLGESKGLVVTADFDARIPEYAVADGTRIGQVVSNLVNNAIKFTEAGYVSVQSRVKASTGSQVTLEVAVTDSGIGIPPDHHRALFEPFRQLDARPDRRYPGTGLGLTISRNLVEAMGGRIRVASVPGRCTEVIFEVPLGVAPDDIGAMRDEQRLGSGGFDGAGLKALIVDDNDINRRYLEAVLAQQGIDAAQVASGTLALDACREREFDMVFMDIHMAGMDGVETTRRLRAELPRYREVPVVAVSADVMGHSRTRFTDQGLDHFMAKPVREKDLTELLAGLFPARAGDDRPGAAGDGHDDRKVLDRGHGVELASGEAALWRRSVGALKEQVRETAPRLRAAVEAGDNELGRQLAHRLAGAAAYVAAGELAGRARALQNALIEDAGDSARRELVALDAAITRFLEVDPDALA